MDSAYYCDFLGEILGIPRYYLKDLKIIFNRYDGSWEVTRSDDVRKHAGIKATEVYGTHRANAFRIFEDCLNQRDTTICDTVQTADGQKKYVVNQSETCRRGNASIKCRTSLGIGYFLRPNAVRTWNGRITACSIRYVCRSLTEVI